MKGKSALFGAIFMAVFVMVNALTDQMAWMALDMIVFVGNVAVLLFVNLDPSLTSSNQSDGEKK